MKVVLNTYKANLKSRGTVNREKQYVLYRFIHMPIIRDVLYCPNLAYITDLACCKSLLVSPFCPLGNLSKTEI